MCKLDFEPTPYPVYNPAFRYEFSITFIPSTAKRKKKAIVDPLDSDHYPD